MAFCEVKVQPLQLESRPTFTIRGGETKRLTERKGGGGEGPGVVCFTSLVSYTEVQSGVVKREGKIKLQFWRVRNKKELRIVARWGTTSI